MHRIVSLLACLAAASALPVKVDPLSQYGPGPSAVPYGPRPYGPLPPQDSYQAKPLYVEEEEEKFEPQPYKYEYGVQDDYSKAAFAKSESQNEVGAVTGSYKVNLPDGRIQTVTYTADPVHGYKAVVSYEGEPVYPPEPEEGYGNQYRRVYREQPEYVPEQYSPEYEQYLPEYVARVQ